MNIVTPTITPMNSHQYREQIERLEKFAKRIHIDLMDGDFAPSRSPGISQLFWTGVFDQVDVHLMYRNPAEHLDELIGLNPDLIIIHAEADGDLVKCIERIKNAGIKAGVSLLQTTSVTDSKELIGCCDHVLIFSGNLGYFGGKTDLGLLDKVGQIKSINSEIEIGWDGGINDENVAALARGGVEVLNVGGFIQRSEDPVVAFGKLNSLL